MTKLDFVKIEKKVVKRLSKGSDEQALDDSIAIWKGLAITGYIKKIDVIEKLHKKGTISGTIFKYHCPLCELYRLDYCVKCPWPREVDFESHYAESRCQGSPDDKIALYRFWLHAKTSKTRKISARKIYKMLKELKKKLYPNLL
jgi:hypothetical protein